MGKRKETTHADMMAIAEKAFDLANEMDAMVKALGNHAPDSTIGDEEISNLTLLSIRAGELSLKFRMVQRMNEYERDFERRLAERKAQAVAAV